MNHKRKNSTAGIIFSIILVVACAVLSVYEIRKILELLNNYNMQHMPSQDFFKYNLLPVYLKIFTYISLACLGIFYLIKIKRAFYAIPFLLLCVLNVTQIFFYFSYYKKLNFVLYAIIADFGLVIGIVFYLYMALVSLGVITGKGKIKIVRFTPILIFFVLNFFFVNALVTLAIYRPMDSIIDVVTNFNYFIRYMAKVTVIESTIFSSIAMLAMVGISKHLLCEPTVSNKKINISLLIVSIVMYAGSGLLLLVLLATRTVNNNPHLLDNQAYLWVLFSLLFYVSSILLAISVNKLNSKKQIS